MNSVCRNASPVWFFRLLRLAIAIVPLPIASSAYTMVLSIKFKASTNKIAIIGAGRRSSEGMN
ncbi:hypothetical protein [Nostoc sp.]|uniref:hypothetical protein n=1 Tax=Nostoc sp. TaxID=1180 RepID=UPI002FFD51BE